MANDLVIAIAIMSCVSILAGLLTGCVVYANAGQLTMLGLTLSVFGTVMFLLYLSGQLFWARLVPVSAAIIYTNFSAVLAALAAGWAWRLPQTRLWRRAAMAMLLSLASLVGITWPLLSIAVRPPPAGGETWENGIAKQTSWATCSPAAAATLLRAEGIDVDESDLIPLCLTDSSGTPTLGLYRGIKLVAERAGRSVAVIDETLEELIAKDDWPVLLTVELPFGAEDRRYVEQWGWIPGMGHSVVAMRRTADGRGVLVGDPSVGLEAWSEKDLKVLWHGGGIRLD